MTADDVCACKSSKAKHHRTSPLLCFSATARCRLVLDGLWTEIETAISGQKKHHKL